MKKIMPVIFLVALAAVGSLAQGQPDKKEPLPTLSGHVTADGRPVNKGRILLYSDDGQIVGSVIDAGKYHVKHPWRGTFSVTLDGPDVSDRYSKPDTSRLKITVRDGENVLDVEVNN